MPRNAHRVAFVRRMAFDAEEFFFGSLPATNTQGTAYCHRCKCDVKEWSSHENEETHASRSAALKEVMASEYMLYQRRKEAIAWKPRISSLSNVAAQKELY
jgi:hypothetical protein